MFSRVQVGAELLCECSQRWYIGRVVERTSMTFVIEEGAAVHQIGDLELFLAGILTEYTDVSPLPDWHEISFADLQSARPLAPGALPKLRHRTHEPQNPLDLASIANHAREAERILAGRK